MDTMDNQDNGQSISEKVTIPVAAKALKVSTKTVQRYIEKGLITKVKEGTRVYVHIDEVRALLNGQPKIDKSPRVQEKDRITVDRTHYDSLLVRLGQLEASQQLLLEYKGNLQARDKELSETKSELDQAKTTISKARQELQGLLKVKQDAEAKAVTLLDQQKALEARERELRELKAENERLKRLKWWERLFGRK